MTGRIVLLSTTHRVAPGLLSWPAWRALASGDVVTADAEHPLLPALADAGIVVDVVEASSPVELARSLAVRSRSGTVVWLCPQAEDASLGRALGELAVRDGGLEIELLPGSYDLPGSRLLDVVSVVDRLRSPGGCPWDAAQTHASLAKYLLEEAYEAYAAIEEDDLVALREEMGDVLVQVALHARLAEEHLPEQRWSIDDVAGDLVAKLVRRHPHVFATATAATPEAVEANWQRLKEAEKSRSSVTEGVPLEQPALALAAKLQERAAGIGAEVPGADPAILRESAAGEHPIDALGELLFHVVALARSQGVDAEAALRATSRRFRDRLAAIETTVRAAGRDPRTLSAAEWESHWANSAAGPATSHSSPPN